MITDNICELEHEVRNFEFAQRLRNVVHFKDSLWCQPSKELMGRGFLR